MSLSETRFEAWLSAYGKAWESHNGQAFGALFAADGLFYRSPFDDPKRGREAIAAAFSESAGRQRDIDFGARLLYVQAQLGAAHWSCSFTRSGSGRRVHIDGVLVAQFDGAGKALSVRQWWHSDER